MNFTEFEEKICKKRIPRTAKVRNSWGIYAVYKHIRKNKWYDIDRPLKEGEFYSIIRKVNKLLADEVAKGNTIVFPSRMGKLELRKYKCGASYVNGRLKITYPIDWQATLRLWYEDPVEREKKTLVRRNNSESFVVKYNKRDANYENRSFYEFALNRFIKQALNENVKKGKIDTLW